MRLPILAETPHCILPAERDISVTPSFKPFIYYMVAPNVAHSDRMLSIDRHTWTESLWDYSYKHEYTYLALHLNWFSGLVEIFAQYLYLNWPSLICSLMSEWNCRHPQESIKVSEYYLNSNWSSVMCSWITRGNCSQPWNPSKHLGSIFIRAAPLSHIHEWMDETVVTLEMIKIFDTYLPSNWCSVTCSWMSWWNCSHP